MNDRTFRCFIEKLKQKLETMIKNQSERFTGKTSPTEFEKIVVEASEYLIKESNYECTIEYTERGHTFPDIVFKFSSGTIYGIEVKSSTNINLADNNWVTLGNSILGSTSKEVHDLYIIFIKVSKKGCFIKTGRYEDSVADVVVTHSPRYKLNLDQDPKESFFSKSGISYNEIKTSNNPIGLVTDYFKNQGQTAWWLAESTPAIIKTWEEVEEKDRQEIFAKAFILFPELVSFTSPNKYKRLSKWLASSYSIVDSSLRDRFTAGGKTDITIGDSVFNDMPKVFENLRIQNSRFRLILKEVSLDELKLYWENYEPRSDTFLERLEFWFYSVQSNLNKTEDSKKYIDFLKALFPEIDRP